MLKAPSFRNIFSNKKLNLALVITFAVSATLVYVNNSSQGLFTNNSITTNRELEQKTSALAVADQFIVRFKSVEASRQFSASRLKTIIPDAKIVRGEGTLTVLMSSENLLKASERDNLIQKANSRNSNELKAVPAEFMKSILESYSLDSNIEYIEPNYIYKSTNVTNNSLFNQQWYLENNAVANDPNHVDIDFKSAIDSQLVDLEKGLIVAVLDTGVDVDHPDLAGSIFRNASGAVIGYDFINFTNATVDGDGHGTHVAGLIAAANNNFGTVGVCPACKIMPVKVLSDNGSGTTYGISNGITYAVENGAQVINLSLGGSAASKTMNNAVQNAVSRGVLVVAAAGNSSWQQKEYPAAYENVITVGATDQEGNRARYSNYGDWVDVYAPGGGIDVSANCDRSNVGILSTVSNGFMFQYLDAACKLDLGNGQRYASISGTSMATPIFSATFALIKAQNPALTNQQVISNILGNTKEMPLQINDNVAGATGKISLLNSFNPPKNKIGFTEVLILNASGGSDLPNNGRENNVNLNLRKLAGIGGSLTINASTNNPCLIFTNATATVNFPENWQDKLLVTDKFKLKADNCAIPQEVALIFNITSNNEAITTYKYPILVNFLNQGWPKQVGFNMPDYYINKTNSPFAADIDADGREELLVAGDKIYAYDFRGDLKPGWPINYNNSDPLQIDQYRLATSVIAANIDADKELEVIFTESVFDTYSRIPIPYKIKRLRAVNHDGTPVRGFETVFDKIFKNPANQALFTSMPGALTATDLNKNGVNEVVLQYFQPNTEVTRLRSRFRVIEFDSVSKEFRSTDINTPVAAHRNDFYSLGSLFIVAPYISNLTVVNDSTPAVIALAHSDQAFTRLKNILRLSYVNNNYVVDLVNIANPEINEINRILSADINRDGNQELVIQYYDDSSLAKVTVVNYRGLFRDKRINHLAGWPQKGYSASLANFTDNADLEIIVGDTNVHVYGLQGNSLGVFGDRAGNFFSSVLYLQPIIADFVGDADPEVLVLGNDSYIYGFSRRGFLWLNNLPSLRPSLSGGPIEGQRTNVVAADLNNDGRKEIYAIGSDYKIYSIIAPGGSNLTNRREWRMQDGNAAKTNSKN